MKKIFFITLLAFLTGTINSKAQENFKLEYKFETGKIYLYKDISKGKITQEMMGQEDRTDIKSETVIKIVPESLASYRNNSLLVSVDTAKITLITKKGDANPDLSSLLGKRTRVIVTNLGRITKKESFDPIRLKGMAENIDIGEMIQFSSVVFPENEIKIGDKWKSSWQDTVEAMGGKSVVESKFEYKLKGTEVKNNHSCLKISYEGKITSEGKGSMQGMEIYFEKENSIDGILYFDYANGLIIADESESEEISTISTTGAHSMMIPIIQIMESKRILIE